MFGHLTYAFFELAWALPVLAVQWAVGWRRLVTYPRILLLGVALPTLYLSATDSVAIAHGIWILHANRILGWKIGNLPLEEGLFFLLTNAMVVQSVLLLAEPWRGLFGRLPERINSRHP